MNVREPELPLLIEKVPLPIVAVLVTPMVPWAVPFVSPKNPVTVKAPVERLAVPANGYDVPSLTTVPVMAPVLEILSVAAPVAPFSEPLVTLYVPV